MTKFIARLADVAVLPDGSAVVEMLVEDIGQAKELRELYKTQKGDKLYAAELKTLRARRSAEQNRYLWALIREIDMEMNGGRNGDDWQIYCEALRRANVAYERILAPIAAVDTLKRVFRAVEFESIDEEKGTAIYRCYIGSSQMNTQEMSLLIDTVLDMAAEVGIESAYWQSVLKGEF